MSDPENRDQLPTIPSREEIRQNLATVILEPLRSQMLAPGGDQRTFPIIIIVNQFHLDGIEKARDRILTLLPDTGLLRPARGDMPYVFGELSGIQIWDLVKADREQARQQESAAAHTPGQRRSANLIHNISLDHELERCLTHSVSTVKADAAWNSYDARGDGVVWAVLDSGVDKGHVHFQKFGNLELPDPLQHKTFVLDEQDEATVDFFGHGTHVAGIIAGYAESTAEVPLNLVREEQIDGQDARERRQIRVDHISGVAPKARILSLRVLNRRGKGRTQAVIEALQYIDELNQNGRRIRVHGVNLSLGYPFDPTWYACGESLICVEVNRLVKSGVMVVIAAGNTGYGKLLDSNSVPMPSNLTCSINDPGNAEYALTVGSTHRDMPHTYGVSYFSSKGPTGDGRWKPDLLAPGERIASCLSRQKNGLPPPAEQYVEDSGTSMAAPHVSGAVAAFLSVREEFKGRPEQVKEIFLNTAIDLKRERYFQGRGLISLIGALQAC